MFGVLRKESDSVGRNVDDEEKAEVVDDQEAYSLTTEGYKLNDRDRAVDFCQVFLFNEQKLH
jgi:hypothetical protein